MLSSPARSQTPLPSLWSYSPIDLVTECAYSPDGAKFALVGEGGVQLFNASNGSFLLSISTYNSFPGFAAFSPDGKSLATGEQMTSSTGASAGLIEIWDVASGAQKLSFPLPYVPNVVGYSPSGKYLVTGGVDNETTRSLGIQALQVWNSSNGTLIRALSTQSIDIDSIGFGTSDSMLAVGGFNSSGVTVELWDPVHGTPPWTVPTKSTSVNAVAISPDGKSLAVGGMYQSPTTDATNGELEIWNVATHQLEATLGTANVAVNAVQFSPDSTTLAAGGHLGGFNSGALELWDWSAGKLLSTVNKTTQEGVTSLTFSPNGKTLMDVGWPPIAAIPYTTVHEWSTSSYQLTSSVSSTIYLFAMASALSPDGKTLMLGGYGGGNSTNPGYLGAWTSQTGQLEGSVRISQPVSSVAYSPDGTLIADTGTSYTSTVLEIRDASTGAVRFSLNDSANKIYDTVEFSPDGTTVAAGGWTDDTNVGFVDLFAVSDGQLISTLQTAIPSNVKTIHYSPDGTKLAIGGNGYVGGSQVGMIEIWDPINTTFLATYYSSEFTINSLHFSPDGTQLAIGGLDYIAAGNTAVGALELWSVASAARLFKLPLTPETAVVSTTHFSPDGNLLYAGTSSGLQVFSTSSGALTVNFADFGVTSLSVSANGSEIGYASTRPQVGVLQGPVSKVQVATSSIVGGMATSATINLTAPAPTGGLTLTTSTNNAYVMVPSSVTVAAGKTSISFPVKTLAVDVNHAVLVSAEANGFSVVGGLMVTAPQLKGLSLSPTSVAGGKTSTGTITLSSAAPLGGLVVSLASTWTAATVPSTVTVPAGATKATFSVSTQKVTSKTKVTVTATFGAETKSCILTIS